MRCSLLLLAVSAVLGNVHHISPELPHHEPLLEATNSAWGFGAMHSGSSVLCNVHVTHSFPGASSKGSAMQTYAPEDGPPENGVKQPHVLGLNTARRSPKFGGLQATATLARAFVYHHVRAAHTHTPCSSLASSLKLPPQSTSTTYRLRRRCPSALALPAYSLYPSLIPSHVPPAIHAGPNRDGGDALHQYDADTDALLSIVAAVRRHHAPQRAGQA